MEAREPLLTVAIPTFNRAAFLDLCLANLVPQLRGRGDVVELLVCDNASSDGTAAVAEKYGAEFPRLRYVRHPADIGSDRNITRCFELARGRYVLLFGDDDVLLPGAVGRILEVLANADHGVVFLRPYGYDEDFVRERPFTWRSAPQVYFDAQKFFRKVHVYCTFISSNVINKRLASGPDLAGTIGTNLVQVRLFCRAALSAASNVYFNDYLVAAKRNNSGGYDYLRVFVENLGEALEEASANGLLDRTRRAIGRTIMFRHLPYYVLRMRAEAGFDRASAHALLRRAYPGSVLYWFCLFPIVRFPLQLATIWTWGLIFASRLAAGELGRIFSFALFRARRAAR